MLFVFNSLLILFALFQCVKQYLQVLITDGSILTITCPDAKCKKQGRIEAPEVCIRTERGED